MYKVLVARKFYKLSLAFLNMNLKRLIYPTLAALVVGATSGHHIESDRIVESIQNAKSVEMAQDTNSYYANKAREEFSWGKEVREDLFLSYILPFKSTEEPYEKGSRKILYEMVSPVVAGITDISEAATKINRWASTQVRFIGDLGNEYNRLHGKFLEEGLSDEELERAEIVGEKLEKWNKFTSENDKKWGDIDLSISQMLEVGYGRCEEQSTFAILSMRAVSIPTRMVYIPWWVGKEGDSISNNHAWIEAWFEESWNYADGSAISEFNQNSITSKKRNMGKVYAVKSSQKGRRSKIDVTERYVQTGEIEVTLLREGDVVTNYDVSLLGWNDGGWKKLEGRKTNESGTVTFVAGAEGPEYRVMVEGMQSEKIDLKIGDHRKVSLEIAS